MRKSRWLSWFVNNLPDYFMIICGTILLLASLASFAHTFHLYEQAKAQHITIGVYWLFDRITRTIGGLTFALWVILLFYKECLRKKLETIEYASRMRKIVYAVWWTTILALVFSTVRIFTIFCDNPSKSVVGLIILSVIVFLLVHTLFTTWAELRYVRKQPLCNIAAAGLLEKGNKFLHAHDFDKAHDAFLKACEMAPEETFLWCHLAHFCELFRNSTTESDKYMAKAEELISTKKANSTSDKARYFNYLGTILYGRGKCEKGLEYMKQSIDIEPNPGRIKSYKERLSEFKAKQPNRQL